MQKIILEAAMEWKTNEPYVGKEIINKVIETIEFEEMKGKLRKIMDNENDINRQNSAIDTKQHLS